MIISKSTALHFQSGKEIKSGKVRRPAIVKSLRDQGKKIMVVEYLFRFSFLFVKFFIVACIVLVCCCKPKGNTLHNVKSRNIPTGQSNVKYAIGFDIVNYYKYKILSIIGHYNETSDTLNYVLYEEGAIIHQDFTELDQIRVPLENIALLHSTYIAFFNFCNSASQIKAISEAKYIYDEVTYSRVQNGELSEVGYGESLDKERLLELDISAVITVGFPNTPNKSQQMMKELGIPALVFSDWQETTVLGRAEWVKVVAALTGNEKFANERFVQIEEEYKRLCSLTKNLDQQPDIICNLPYKGSWYVPGGNSYVSNLLHDAGANYIWAKEEGTGGIQMDFETVYAKGLEADYWINTDFANSRQDIIDKDERLLDLKPMKNGNIFNGNRRMARGISNDYWESGIINPQVILADLIKILHPELLPDHQLIYYKQID